MPGLLDLTQGQNNGLFNNFMNQLREGVSPIYRQEQQQQRALQQDFANLAQIYGPQQALMYVNHPDILSERLKPQIVGPGDTLMSAAGMGGQPMPQVPGLPQMGSPVTQPPQQGAPQQPNNVYGANTNGLNDPATLDRLVDQRLLGDKSVEQGGSGLGAGGKIGQINKAAFNKLLTQRMTERGITPQELTSRTAKFPAYGDAVKKLTDIQARMGQAAIEFDKMWPVFMQQVAKTNPGQFPTANAFQQFLKLHAGDPNVAPLAGMVNSMRNIYGNAISRRAEGATVDDKKHFDETLSKAWNPAQLNSVGNAFHAEMQAAHDSMPAQANVLKVDFGLAEKPTPEALNFARDAIKRGAPPERVKQRMKEMGFRPEGF